jgi:hypothetical protein
MFIYLKVMISSDFFLNAAYRYSLPARRNSRESKMREQVISS